MRKKNGFTLIELLAIIVILAIIAVITVPIILNIIDNATKGADQDSAYGYTKSLSQYFAQLLVQDKDRELPSGVYYLTETGELTDGTNTIEINVSGKEPSDGWVKLEKGNVISYSLKFDENVVSKEINGEETIEKTENVHPTDEIVKVLTAERGTVDDKNAIAFLFHYEIPEYYEIQEVGLNYGTNKLAGADTTVSGYGTVNLTEPNNLGVTDVESVFKYNTTGSVKNSQVTEDGLEYRIFNFTLRYSIGTNVSAYVYGIGYIDLLTPTNKTIRVYSNFIATTYNSLPE